MRNILLFIVFAFVSAPCFAQLQNLGFENWHTDSAASNKLDNWFHYTGNTRITSGNQPGTWREPNSHSGNYALKVSRWYGSAYDHVVQSCPLNFLLHSISGFYLYTGAGLSSTSTGPIDVQDSAVITALVTRWNFATASRDTISVSNMKIGEVASYTRFEMFMPVVGQTPDSMFLHICPTMYTHSNTPWCPGGGYCSYLTIDDLLITPEAGVPITYNETGITMSPNPAIDRLKLVINNTTHSSLLDVTTISGKVFIHNLPIGPVSEIDVSSLAPGIYLLSVQNRNQVIHARFVKQ